MALSSTSVYCHNSTLSRWGRSRFRREVSTHSFTPFSGRPKAAATSCWVALPLGKFLVSHASTFLILTELVLLPCRRALIHGSIGGVGAVLADAAGEFGLGKSELSQPSISNNVTVPAMSFFHLVPIFES